MAIATMRLANASATLAGSWMTALAKHAQTIATAKEHASMEFVDVMWDGWERRANSVLAPRDVRSEHAWMGLVSAMKDTEGWTVQK